MSNKPELPKGLTVWHQMDTAVHLPSDQEVEAVVRGAKIAVQEAKEYPWMPKEAILELQVIRRGQREFTDLGVPHEGSHFVGYTVGLRASESNLGLAHNFDEGFRLGGVDMGIVRTAEAKAVHIAERSPDRPFLNMFGEALEQIPNDESVDTHLLMALGSAIGVRHVQLQAGVEV